MKTLFTTLCLIFSLIINTLILNIVRFVNKKIIRYMPKTYKHKLVYNTNPDIRIGSSSDGHEFIQKTFRYVSMQYMNEYGQILDDNFNVIEPKRWNIPSEEEEMNAEIEYHRQQRILEQMKGFIDGRSNI